MGSSGKLITSAMILDGTIATADIAPGAVSQLQSSIVTPGQTTSSASMVDVANGSVTLTTSGGTVLVSTSGSVANSTAGAITVVALAADGVGGSEYSLVTAPTASGFGAFSQSVAYPTTAGPHTFKAQWRCTAGTATLQSGLITAIELKR